MKLWGTLFTRSSECFCLQSENATVILPELDFEAESGGLCGKFTTVEGLLDNIKTQVVVCVLCSMCCVACVV